MTTATIPAAFGYFVVWPDPYRCQGYARAPVVGWAATDHAPITVYQYEPPPEAIALLCPDGTVNQLDGGNHWPSIDVWLIESDRNKPS